MENDNVNAHRTRIVQIVAGLALFGLMVYSVQGLMAGSRGVAAGLASVLVGTGVVLALDKYYWLLAILIPAAGMKLPGIPFTPSELGAVILVVVFFFRAAFHWDVYRFTATSLLWIALPYFLWTMFVFLLNPVGLHLFGSSMIGGRHYFDLVLGFLALFVLSRIELSETGLKWAFYGYVACSLVHIGIIYHSYWVGLELEPELVGTRYYLIPLGSILMLMLARFDLTRVFSVPWLFFVCLVLFGGAIISGKRTTVGSVLLLPFVLMFLRRREYLLTLFLAISGSIVLSIVVAGQGWFYELPRSVQRGLSFLPGRWDRRYEAKGFNDDFRNELQRRAREIIQENPWVGRCGFAMDVREIAWVALYSGARDTMYGGHELAGNWHNKFYGMWADFGVIAPFAWYGFVIAVVIWGFRRRNSYLDDSYASTFYRYWLYSMILDLVLAYGHSANTPFGRWQTFGFLLALHNMRRRQFDESRFIEAIPSPSSTGSSMPVGAVI